MHAKWDDECGWLVPVENAVARRISDARHSIQIIGLRQPFHNRTTRAGTFWSCRTTRLQRHSWRRTRDGRRSAASRCRHSATRLAPEHECSLSVQVSDAITNLHIYSLFVICEQIPSWHGVPPRTDSPRHVEPQMLGSPYVIAFMPAGHFYGAQGRANARARGGGGCSGGASCSAWRTRECPGALRNPSSRML
jgi:hypothetical protein